MVIRWGATVTFDWDNGLKSGTASCTTGPDGLCQRARRNGEKRTSMTIIVTSIVHAELTYEPDGNTDADGDSDGTTIIINKPS